MNRLFSDKEVNKLKKFISKNLITEQGYARRLADALESANSSGISKAIKNVDPKLATNFLNTELKSFDDIVKNLNDYKVLWINSGIDWGKTNKIILSLKKYSDTGFLKTANTDLILQVINDLPLEGDLRGIAFDLWQKSKGTYTPKNVKSKSVVVKNKKSGQNIVQKTENNQVKNYEVDNNGKLSEISDSELDLEIDSKEKPVQVAGVKLDDIPKDEWDIIDASFEKYGVRDNWGFDQNTGEPIYVLLQIGGEKVKFSLNSFGPEQFDNTKITADGLTNIFKGEYEKTFENTSWMNKPFIEDWIKKEKILKDPKLREKYVSRFDVSLGVKLWADEPNGDYGPCIIANNTEIQNYRKTKTTEDLKNSILHTIYHELTHVKQDQRESGQHSRSSYKSGDFKDGKEALDYLNTKRDKVTKKYSNTEKVNFDFWGWHRQDNMKAEEIISDFGDEKGIDVTLDYSWRDDFFEWGKDKKIFDEKFIKNEKIKTEIDPYKFSINLFGDDVKIRTLKLVIDSGNYKKIKEKTDNLNDKQFLKFIDNNINIPEVETVVKDAAKELGYWSNVKEIEAEFGANIKSLMELGTLEQNKGFATFLVDYLRGTGKSQKLADIDVAKYKNYMDTKYPMIKSLDKVSSGIDTVKGFFKSFIDKFLNKNVTDKIKLEKELTSVDGWVNNIPDDFFVVLEKLEHRWKKVYPEQAKKIEKDLYKQAYDLISKGYPALLPFIVSGLSDDKTENSENKNESIIYKKSYITESYKKTYSFDWDDNILKMPTRIHLEYKAGGLHWVPVSVSTEQFRSIRNKIGTEFRYLNDNVLDAFKDFREYESFIRDVTYALDGRSFGPSFNDFKEALINGEDFSIITARSTSPLSLIDGIKLLIDKNFSLREKDEMEKNLKGTSINDYLKIQDYHPVSSKEFLNNFNLDLDGSNPEKGKEIAFRSFVDRVVKQIDDIIDDTNFEGISVGYSDDDLNNLEIIENLIRKELSLKYPKIKFNVYDTSDSNNPKKKRIVIEK